MASWELSWARFLISCRLKSVSVLSRSLVLILCGSPEHCFCFSDSPRIGRALTSTSSSASSPARRSEDKFGGSAEYNHPTSSPETSSSGHQQKSSSSALVLELREPVQRNGVLRGTGDLDTLTMINSPLHLDSIL